MQDGGLAACVRYLIHAAVMGLMSLCGCAVLLSREPIWRSDGEAVADNLHRELLDRLLRQWHMACRWWGIRSPAETR